MFSLVTIRKYKFSLVITEKSNIDFESNKILDNNNITELDSNPSSVIVKAKGKNKELISFHKLKENDEIIIKNKNYIILHKLKY